MGINWYSTFNHIHNKYIHACICQMIAIEIYR